MPRETLSEGSNAALVKPMARAPLFEVGDVVGGLYEIRSILGQGVMGQVFEAYDRALARRVAIKANFDDAEESLQREAQGLAALRHPCVAGVYAFGTHHGTEFMVMEHVAGVTLAYQLYRFERHGLPLAECLGILLAVAEGLAAIHRAGLSHGDIKPENVLLSASGRVVLADLGLVRPAYESESADVFGTPEYMAPEVLSSKFANAGGAFVDAYAFGVLAFRVLTGRLPFASKFGLELVRSHLEESPPRVFDVAPHIPRRLQDLVAQLLAKDATERPASMDAVVWQLRVAQEELARDHGTAGGLAARGADGATATDATDASVDLEPEPLQVLVIDDDADIGRLVAMYVTQVAPTAEVTVVVDAQEALEVFRTSAPRLVFLDLMMPKVTGFELFTYLRGVHLVDSAVVVAMSAGGSAADVQLMLELGAHAFLTKGPELRRGVTRIVTALAPEPAPVRA